MPPLSLAFEEVFYLCSMRKSKISSFEESRRALKNIFMNITEWKKKPRIVDVRTKDLEEEVTYKALLQDLYLSHLEDNPEDRRTYQEQLQEFQEWYSKLEPGLDHFLVERLILRDGYSNLSEEEAKELRDRYFRKQVKISVVRIE